MAEDGFIQEKKNILKDLDIEKIYEPNEAIKVLKEKSYVKFNETVDISINLGITLGIVIQNTLNREKCKESSKYYLKLYS